MKKIISKRNNLLNYFTCDHRTLNQSYLKNCEKFFKKINQG